MPLRRQLGVLASPRAVQPLEAVGKVGVCLVSQKDNCGSSVMRGHIALPRTQAKLLTGVSPSSGDVSHLQGRVDGEDNPMLELKRGAWLALPR